MTTTMREAVSDVLFTLGAFSIVSLFMLVWFGIVYRVTL